MPDSTPAPLSLSAQVDQIAAALNETNPMAIMQIKAILKLKGLAFAEELFRETQAVEAQGGMLVPNGKRRRTIGGVFFVLANGKLTPEEQAVIFLQRKPKESKPASTESAAPSPQHVAGDVPPPPPAADVPAPAAAEPLVISPVARQIAAEVGLSEQAALDIIELALQAAGAPALQDLVREAKSDAKEGGLDGLDHTHLLRPGEIFVYQAYLKIPIEKRRALPPPLGLRIPPRPTTRLDPAAMPPPPPPPAGKDKGATAKVTLIGRPTKIVPGENFVELTFATGPLPSLPKGLPAANGPVTLIAYVSSKQWKKAESFAQDPTDKLILEGYWGVDAATKRQVVFVSNASTKLIQAAQRPPVSAETKEL